MNNYIIESSDIVVINEEVNNILKKHKLTSDMIIKYNLLETSISNVIMELDTYNFLVPNKVIVCDNAYFLTDNNPRGVVSHDISDLVKYLENPSKDNILVLICDKLSKNNKLIKLFDDNNIISGELNIDSLIKNRLSDFKMDTKTIKYLIDCCHGDNERILNELDKLKCYKWDEKIITSEDIDTCVIRLDEENIFDLIDSIVSKNKSKAHKLTHELFEKGEDISRIVSVLSDQFRLMYQSKILLLEGKTQPVIAKELGVHPYRVKLAVEKGRSYSNKMLLSLLEKLFDLDYMIKTGAGAPKLYFDLFLSNL